MAQKPTPTTLAVWNESTRMVSTWCTATGLIALQELLTLLPCPPLFLRFPCPSPVALYFATFPFVATTTATIDGHHLLPSLPSLPSSSFAFFFTIFASFRFFASTRSDASACKARSRAQTGVFLSLLLPLYTLSRPLDLSSPHVTFHSLPFFPYSSHNYLSQFFDPSYSPLPWYPLYLSVFAILSSVTLSRSLFRSIRARVRLTASLHLAPPCRRLRRYTEICIRAESRAQKERDYRGPLTYYREPPLACL